jgi:ligand-binding sensor domain-containing protein/serine phosphatase RsbU (regulator of sigma subunit)
LKIIHILVPAVLITFSLGAQLQVRNYFSVTGRKDVPVTSVTQDSTGFLWLGTRQGLYRFDGRSPAQQIRDSVLLRQDITAVHVDPSQKVWIGTRSGGVFIYDGKTTDSLRFGSEPNTDRITSICDADSGICFSTYGNGVYGYRNATLFHLTIKQGMSDNVVYTVRSAFGSLWCATDAGICRIGGIFGRRRLIVISNKNGLPDNIVRDISAHGERLVIAMQDSGICYYNIRKKRIERDVFFTNWSHGVIVNARVDYNNRLLVATENKGLLRIVKGKIEVYRYEEYILGGSAERVNVNALYLDRSGQVWLASKRGLSTFIEQRFNFISARHGLADEKILALARDRDNGLWVGTAMGVFRISYNEEGKTDILSIPGLDKLTISCATNGPDGEIWLGTYGSGIVVFSPVEKKPVYINSERGGLTNDNISGIFFHNDSVAFVSTLGGGVNRLSIRRGAAGIGARTTEAYTEKGGLGSDYVYAVVTNKEGNLFVATDGGGLQVFRNGRYDRIMRDRRGNSTVYALCRDSLDAIWFVTDNDGVLRYDGRRVTSVRRFSEVMDEPTQQLAASGTAVFAVHAKGVDKIGCSDFSVTHYDVFDGDLEPNLNAIAFNEGKIYCGTNNGVLVFRTTLLSADSVKPTAYIRNVLLDFKQVRMDSSRSFRYTDNNFSMSFDGVWLKNPEKLTYRYMLKGWETSWILADDGKQVNYQNLSPGSYTFVVQSRNEEEIWSTPATYSFTILTPLWQRWWFWVIVVAGVSAAVFLLIRVRLRALRRENLLLERRVKERTVEIERQKILIEQKNVALEQLSLVASKTDNVVLILDPAGRLEYVNESFTKQHPVPASGKTIFELSSHPAIRDIIADAVANRKSVNYESHSRNNGRTSWQSSTLTPIFDDEGALRKMIIIDTDVTDRKRQEQVILQKNKDITDSISYARKIQHAILPDTAVIRKYIPNAFVLYMTKDIVSGDFYWFNHFRDYSIISAVDCTGHGVPGAFMSLIGYNLLNRIVNEKRIDDPSRILTELNLGVVNALNKRDSESRDGMDIALCKIWHKEKKIEFAGAMRPIWILQNGTVAEIRADKIPIGTKETDREGGIGYTTQVISPNPGDKFFIFTDGYPDQFGGEKDKKYSTARFRDFLIRHADAPMEKFEQLLRDEHLSWKGDNEQVDDILVIGFSL